jgi:hypothetical protein
MFKSIKAWINVDVIIKHVTGLDGTGSNIPGRNVSEKCYPVSKNERVVDKFGAEVVSSTQLYFNGDVAISRLDEIIFEGETRPIQTIDTYYSNGVPDIKVVFL